MKSILYCRRILDRAWPMVSYCLAGAPETEERRYCEAVTTKAAEMGRSGDWPSLVALVLFMTASGSSLGEAEKAAILQRALSRRSA